MSRRRALLGVSGGAVIEDGSQQYPFLIKNAVEFHAFIESVSNTNNYTGIYHKIVNNIDLTGFTFSTSNADRNYYGHLDGNYKVVSNFSRVNGYGGLFRNCRNGSIKRLGLENVYVSGTEACGIGGDSSTIEECYVTGNIACRSGNYMGGISYYHNGNITDCYTNVQFSSINGAGIRSGGIAGQLTNPNKVTNCLAIGDMDLLTGNASGIVAEQGTNNLVVNCVSAMNILNSTSGGTVGRITGGNSYLVANCHALDTMLVRGAVVTTGTSTNLNGANATITQLKTRSFYENILGWDFVNIWKINEGVNFPKLKGFG